MATKTLAIYLAKPDVADFSAVLSESARDKLNAAGTQVIDVDDFANGARIYIFASPPDAPKWLKELRKTFDVPGRILTSSACGILTYRAADRIFISPFAHGWMYLDEENVEGDFGLRAALNILNDKKLRRIERANLGDALRAVSQSPFQRDFKSFGLDDALDLVRKISGTTNDDATADSVSGSQSLKLTGEFGLRDLPELSAEALEHFNSTAYQGTSFKIIDHVMPVMDQRTISQLDDQAAESIINEEPDFELGLPVTSDSEMIGYRFAGPGLRGKHPDLMMRNYTEALGDKLQTLTPQTLRDHKICAIFDDGKPEKKWSIRTSLVGSVIFENNRYAINEGEWYRLDAAFKDSIEQNFQDLIRPWPRRPTPLRRVHDADGNGTYQTEASYNRETAAATGYCLLDTKLIEIPEIQRSGFEACDLLDIAQKRFIHVKKSSRRSSVLSHFFKQGSNSAKQLSSFPEAWTALKALVRRECGEVQENALEAAIEDTDRRWTVEFHIADTPRANGEFNIPFFSKISLRDEAINLHAMQYDVVLRFIGLDNH